MIITLKKCLLILAATVAVTYLNAQNAAPGIKNQDIIIHKKDSVKEKITVIIDGNDVTVNGKPIDDFVSNDIDIIKNNTINDYNLSYGGELAPMPPMPPTEIFKEDMLRNIKTNSAFLGVMTEAADNGAKITEVTEKSAAEKAGLKEDDIITKIGDDKIAGPDDLYKVVGKHKPDEKVVISYVRDGKTSTVTVTLDKADQMHVYSWNTPNAHIKGDFNMPGFSFDWNNKPRLGISAQDTEDGNGVKIIDVDDDDAPAAKAGLKENDIITQVNGKAITSTDDLKQSVKDIKKGDTLKITYKRNNQTQTVDVKFPKDLKTVDL